MTTPTDPVVVVVGRYPLVTTTFIDRELDALRARGVVVDVLAVRRPPADVPLSSAQRALGAAVRYLLPTSPWAVARANARAMATRPATYWRTLGFLLSRPHPSLRARLMTAAHFVEGVLAADLVRDAHPRELYAHFADRAAVIALVASRLLGIPYSVSIHAGADVYVHPTLLKEKVEHARCVVTCTGATQAAVAAVVGDALGAKVRPMRHGIELDRFVPRVRGSRAEPQLLAVGQLRAKKGFGVLIDACAVLRDRGVAFGCTVIGEGELRAELEQRIDAIELGDRVRLRGALSHDDVVGEYSRADVFVLPCVQTSDGHVDGIPNVVPEAMASGLAVVSSGLPAIRELVTDGVDGVLTAPGDPIALADALEALLSDPETRARLGREARATVEREFDVDENVGLLARALWPDLALADASR
ncbi:MAG TPA: glycosyltransferase [Acidimicrobiia bacterium]|nr:glycosyltransferase [Acidimicrobiia bacterium]